MMKKETKLLITVLCCGVLVIYLSFQRTIRVDDSVPEEVDTIYENDRYLDSIRIEENKEYDNELNDPESERYRSNYSSTNEVVTVTKYNPLRAQCDDTPLITASGRKIDMAKLKEGNLRWIAVSRDLRRSFEYGSVVELIAPEGEEISGEWIVTDTMNPRWIRRVDLLCPPGDTLGKWNSVIIKKKKKKRGS